MRIRKLFDQASKHISALRRTPEQQLITKILKQDERGFAKLLDKGYGDSADVAALFNQAYEQLRSQDYKAGDDRIEVRMMDLLLGRYKERIAEGLDTGTGVKDLNDFLISSIALCQHSNVEIATMLIKHGIKPEYTALSFALMIRSSDMAALLLQHGVDPRTKDANGAELLSSIRGDGVNSARRMLEVFAAAGLDLSKSDTAITNAARNGDNQALEYLIKSGANIRAVDREGSTVLALAENAAAMWEDVSPPLYYPEMHQSALRCVALVKNALATPSAKTATPRL